MDDRDWPDEPDAPHSRDSDHDLVDDPTALAAAEEAARHADDQPERPPLSDEHIDEPWARVASAPGMDPGRSLEPVYEALCEAGIPAGFDPYRPGVAASPYPVVQRLFSVMVPESRLQQAKDTLRDMGVIVPSADTGTRPADLKAGNPTLKRVVGMVLVIVLLALAAQLVGSLFSQWGILR